MNLYGKIDVNWHVRKLFSQQKTDAHRTVFAEPLIAILHTAEQIELDRAELLADIDLDIEISVIKTYLTYEKPMDITKPETILW